MKAFFYTTLFFLCFCNAIQAQKDSLDIVSNKKSLLTVNNYNPLSPAKAAFLSAVIPGAGQIYNNKYWWQLPLIYGGLGYSIHSYIKNNNEYHRYREAFKLKQAGLPGEFNDSSDARLQSAQELYNYNRNWSLLSAIIVYVLQITEASVSAHLSQFSTNKNLTISPSALPSYEVVQAPNVGLTLKYSF